MESNLRSQQKRNPAIQKKDTVPTEIAEYFNFTLSAVSCHLRILKDVDLITEKKQQKNMFYTLNRDKSLELVEFFEDIDDYNLKSLKEYVEGEEKKKKDLSLKKTM